MLVGSEILKVINMWVKVGIFAFVLQFFVNAESENATVTQVGTRIVGGRIASIKSFPYQVSVQVGTSHVCGGALIARNLVLSAAHCFQYSQMPEVYRVRLGSNTTSSGGQFIQVKNVTVHEKYGNLDNDIALAELSQNPTLSDTVQIINISRSDAYTAGTLAVVSGWGHEQENGTLSRNLMSVDIPLTTRQSCALSYSGLATISLNMICAGYPTGGKDACQGDSGGPLAQDNQLIGLVSFGMGCARTYPGVYTNVARFYDWIIKNSNLSSNTSNSTCDYFWCFLINGDSTTSINSFLVTGSVIAIFIVNILFTC